MEKLERHFKKYLFKNIYSETADKGERLRSRPGLYASDAVNLAVAVLHSRNMLTEDRHLFKASVKDYVESLGLRIIRLTELFPS